jgi:hypothetical protein
MVPKEIAPNLFNMARFKMRSVNSELQNSNWLRNLGVIDTPELLAEFVLLHVALTTVSLNSKNDIITWKWIANGKFSVASSYECKFNGAFSYFPASAI